MAYLGLYFLCFISIFIHMLNTGQLSSILTCILYLLANNLHSSFLPFFFSPSVCSHKALFRSLSHKERFPYSFILISCLCTEYQHWIRLCSSHSTFPLIILDLFDTSDTCQPPWYRMGGCPGSANPRVNPVHCMIDLESPPLSWAEVPWLWSCFLEYARLEVVIFL